MDDVPLRPRPGSEKEPRVHSSPPRSVASTTYLEPPPPTPGYGASALLLQPSPLMTSDLHPRNSATTTQESIYLRRAKFLRWSRLVLTVLVVCTALATVGCAGHVLDKYNSTQAKFHLPPLWPINVDLRPTLAVMISACLMMALSVTYLAVSFIPTVGLTIQALASTTTITDNSPAALSNRFLQHSLLRHLRRRLNSYRFRPRLCQHAHRIQLPPPARVNPVVDLQILRWGLAIHSQCAIPEHPRLRVKWYAHSGRLQAAL